MQDDRVVVDVPMTMSLGDAVGDVRYAFSDMSGSAGISGDLNLMDSGEWNEVWYKFALYLEALNNRLENTAGRLNAIYLDIYQAAENYIGVDQSNEHILVLRPPPQ